jgi:hypothetical protein
MTDTTPCRTTQHCAYHGWCRRCDPAFADLMAKVNIAIQHTDTQDSHWGPLYAAIAEALRPVLPPPADRAAVLREAADRYATLVDQNEAYELAEHGAIDHESRLQFEAVRDVVTGLRRMAAEAQPAQPQTGARVGHWQPVPLATPCAHCAHPFNWHDRTGCQFGNDDRCRCDAFVPGKPPAPIDPRNILGANEDPAQP